MHTVERLWVRPVKSGPMEERDTLEAVTDSGVVGDHAFGRKRHVTLVFRDDWARAVEDLGREVEAAARRANVLLSGGGGVALLGSVVRLGDAVIEVKGVTAPCVRMDQAAEGLRAALTPDGRSGVWGLVRSGGTIRRGDVLVVS